MGNEYDEKKVEALIEADVKRKAYGARRLVWHQLMIKKAQEAGLVVSKDEEDKEMKRKAAK